MTIFEFLDYRTYLRKYIESLPRKGRGEINRMANAIGVHPSLLSQVLADDKNLSLEQGQQATEYLGLSEQEKDYFMTMILYQRAGTHQLRTYYKGKLVKIKAKAHELIEKVKQDRRLSEEEKAIFFSHWHYNAIWLYTSIESGKTLEQIYQYFQLTRERTKQILDFLVETQLCIAESGFFRMGPQSLHLERTSPFIDRHHTNWRLRALELSDKLKSDELMYTGPISISKADFEVLCHRLKEFIKDYSETVMKSEAEDLACLNLDFFWIKK